MPTEYGVEYDLARSDYKYYWGAYELRFSSATHLKKFCEQVDVKTEWLSDSLSRRFHFTVNADLIAVIQLYVKVETRGCWIRNIETGEVATCHENIALVGMKLKLNG